MKFGAVRVSIMINDLFKPWIFGSPFKSMSNICLCPGYRLVLFVTNFTGWKFRQVADAVYLNASVAHKIDFRPCLPRIDTRHILWAWKLWRSVFDIPVRSMHSCFAFLFKYILLVFGSLIGKLLTSASLDLPFQWFSNPIAFWSFFLAIRLLFRA